MFQRIMMVLCLVGFLAGCTGTAKGAKELGKGVAIDSVNAAGVVWYGVDKTDQWIKTNMW